MPDDLFADFYHASYDTSQNGPNWNFISTKATTTTGDLEVLEVDYDLPGGTMQAIRVHFRYLGSVGMCPDGTYWNYGDVSERCCVSFFLPVFLRHLSHLNSLQRLMILYLQLNKPHSQLYAQMIPSDLIKLTHRNNKIFNAACR